MQRMGLKMARYVSEKLMEKMREAEGEPYHMSMEFEDYFTKSVTLSDIGFFGCFEDMKVGDSVRQVTKEDLGKRYASLDHLNNDDERWEGEDINECEQTTKQLNLYEIYAIPYDNKKSGIEAYLVQYGIHENEKDDAFRSWTEEIIGEGYTKSGYKMDLPLYFLTVCNGYVRNSDIARLEICQMDTRAISERY